MNHNNLNDTDGNNNDNGNDDNDYDHDSSQNHNMITSSSFKNLPGTYWALPSYVPPKVITSIIK